MPPLVIPNTIQARLIWTISGIDHAVNVLHFANPLGIDADVDMANALRTAVQTAGSAVVSGAAFAANLSTVFAIERVSVRNIDEANQPEIFDDVEGNVVTGTGASEPLPVSTALAVTLRTALAGKSYRGRVYLLGYSEGNNDSAGHPTTLCVTRSVAFVDRIRTEMANFGLVMAVASRTLGVSTNVTSVDADQRWDTQRRRNEPGI